MKRLGIFILFALLALAFAGGSASAQIADDLPEDIEVFYVDGHTIVRDTEFGTMIYWCTGECGDMDCPTPTPPPTPPTATPTAPPPQNTPTPTAPTPEPPTPTPTPEPEKPKANCGLGNYEEGADPNENACHKDGFTGEDGEWLGPPGQRP